MKTHFAVLLVCSFNTISSNPIQRSDNPARIVNGYEVEIAEVPYQVSLRRRSTSSWTHFCGAVLIDERAVLTAAHCADTYRLTAALIRITVGTTSRSFGGTSYNVANIIVHEAYSLETLDNDIALIIPTERIRYGPNIRAIAYAPKYLQLPGGTEAIVSGFGAIAYEGSSSQVLLAARVYITDQETCARAYLRFGDILSGMICAGATNPPRDACQGDSGGPLVAKGFLVGIVSWGQGCANENYPGVYTRVSHYYDWIKDHLVN